MSYLIEIAIIVILIVFNGIFAMSEFAIVSARKARLQQRAEKGDAGAATALALAESPTSFLSTIQIGITLVGILAGAFGGATVAAGVVPFFQEIPALAPYSQVLSITLVVLVITYLTLIFGELVPKRIALTNAETIASTVARPMRLLSVVATPVVFVLSRSTEAVLKVMGIRDAAEPPVTEEEIMMMLEEGTRAGVFERSELHMLEGVFDLDDRRVESLMTPRPHIVALDLDDPDTENLRKMVQSGRSRFPVYEGDPDNIVGMVSVKKVMAKMEEGTSPAIRAAVTEPFFVPEGLQVLKLIEAFKETGLNIALVTDEYGSVQGLVTLHDVLEAIVGDVRTLRERAEVGVVVREDGSWLIDGSTAVENIKEILSVDVFPGEEEGRYHSLAGLIMYVLERIPRTGDYIELGNLRYEVVDMDGNRVDKVLVTRVAGEPGVGEGQT
ncbi:HlyC/CorC family transporter [Methanofollis formosanus]|uniref:HlyC/CorC family transporter n=1 Tax=Methanofollis formosanus TaxID=299308 RepID=A0A8G1EHA4_9EURY|nr:hemolysin family protein [Methanofollis formosanus]QYZ79772.1 HlyC/CorC family transporter [Methanofollis formosanus]